MKYPSAVHDLISLLFPELCLVCSKEEATKDVPICLACQGKLPKTTMFDQANNSFEERFWGQLPLHAGAAYYYFSKKGSSQKLIHQLKYRKKKELGIIIGRWIGEAIKSSPRFRGIDCLVPVPLHPRKLHQRGFNQAAMISQGIAETSSIIHLPTLLQRDRFTQTQTRKSRFNRIANVAGAFSIHDEKKVKNKHILLVDDVMTTGATLLACAAPLEALGCKISIVTMGIAEQ